MCCVDVVGLEVSGAMDLTLLVSTSGNNVTKNRNISFIIHALYGNLFKTRQYFFFENSKRINGKTTTARMILRGVSFYFIISMTSHIINAL